MAENIKDEKCTYDEFHRKTGYINFGQFEMKHFIFPTIKKKGWQFAFLMHKMLT